MDGVRTESVNGGQDVWSSSKSLASTADHLVVMVNGILGRATDWKFAADEFVTSFPDKVIVHCSECNVSTLTLDGVDVMGERLAKEVVEVIGRKQEIKKISFVAHSVGGLVARYAIGRLYKPSKENPENKSGVFKNGDRRGTIAGLEAVNFITVATPHLGSRGNKQVPFLFGVPVLEKTACLVIKWIFKRTGQHLFLTDTDKGDTPLLKRMVDDCGDLYYMSALRAFRRRVVYSNVGYDHIVGWRTSSIRRNSELPKWKDSVSKRYPHIVYEEQIEGSDAEMDEPGSGGNDRTDVLEEELVAGLSRVSWEKVDVSFHTSKRKFAAHSVIQVKVHPIHSEGADVIRHMIDNFLT